MSRDLQAVALGGAGSGGCDSCDTAPTNGIWLPHFNDRPPTAPRLPRGFVGPTPDSFSRQHGRVQDRYAGDVGDFLKFGLLRYLTDGEPRLRVGVVWYRTPDESHNSDGKHVAYLDERRPDARYLRSVDSDLFDRLAGLVNRGDRTIGALEAAELLVGPTAYFNELLDLSDLPGAARDARTKRRAEWVERAGAATAESDLIFFDPDNGIRLPQHPTQRHRTKSVKHAYLDELSRFAARGQSAIVYHHADRSAPVEVQAQRRLAELADELPLHPLAAVRASRGTVRLFLIAASPAHEPVLDARLATLETSPWRNELRVIRPR